MADGRHTKNQQIAVFIVVTKPQNECWDLAYVIMLYTVFFYISVIILITHCVAVYYFSVVILSKLVFKWFGTLITRRWPKCQFPVSLISARFFRWRVRLMHYRGARTMPGLVRHHSSILITALRTRRKICRESSICNLLLWDAFYFSWSYWHNYTGEFKPHCTADVKALCRAGYQLRQLRPVLQSMTAEATRTVTAAFILTRLDYCNSLLCGLSNTVAEAAVCSERHRTIDQ